ncbi:uncharacterized protein LOC124887768 [Capsicum annuum]|uniref:uncharacterized protein LOC124887768 n=1 Tax=Capsicum annuum TaxID=4072 RepID=UPI001FB12588|nr:uncharacterized protein LOC124887768 [Capsicum annuum]
MAGKIVKKPVGILYDILVPIILGRPFLATGKTLIDMEKGHLMLRLNDELVTFNRLGIKALTVVIMNFDSNGLEDYEDLVSVLHGSGYNFAPSKHDLYLKNRTTLPARPSIEEPPVLELKTLPSHFQYAFLRAKNILPVVIAVDLRQSEEVVKKEIIKWLDAGVVYPIADSKWRQGTIYRRHELLMTPVLQLEVFDVWGIDFIGPFMSSFGKKYILVVVDYVSKWVEAIALPNNEARSVTAFLRMNIFS